MEQPGDRSRRLFLEASSMLGLAAAFGPETTGEALADSHSKTITKEDTMAESSASQRGSGPAADKTATRPFQVNVSEAELAELRRRIHSTRWPDRETVTDESQGKTRGEGDITASLTAPNQTIVPRIFAVRGRLARRQFPCAAVRPDNTFGTELPTLRCLRGFLFSVR